MKINKLSVKRGARILALSVSLVTSGMSFSGCAKVSKPKEVTVDVDSSIFEVMCKKFELLKETDQLFIVPEKISELDESEIGVDLKYLPSGSVRIPWGYYLEHIDLEKTNVGMLGLDYDDDYVYFNPGEYVHYKDGTKASGSVGGSIGVHKIVDEMKHLRNAVLASIKNNENYNNYRFSAWHLISTKDGYYSIASDEFGVYYIGDDYSNDGIVPIDIKETFNYDKLNKLNSWIVPEWVIGNKNINDFVIIPNDVKQFLIYSNNLDKLIEDAYYEKMENVKTR